LLKDKNLSIIGSHCVIHRQDLAAKTLPPKLEVCIKVVDTIKSSAFNPCIFKILHSELSAENSVLLFNTKVCWLSKDSMFKRLYE